MKKETSEERILYVWLTVLNFPVKQLAFQSCVRVLRMVSVKARYFLWRGNQLEER